MYLARLTHWEEGVVDRGRGDMCLVCGRSNGPGISSGDIQSRGPIPPLKSSTKQQPVTEHCLPGHFGLQQHTISQDPKSSTVRYLLGDGCVRMTLITVYLRCSTFPVQILHMICSLFNIFLPIPLRSSLFNIFLSFPLRSSLFNIFLSISLRSLLFNIFLSFPAQLKLSCFPSGARFLFPIFSRGCQLLQKSAQLSFHQPAFFTFFSVHLSFHPFTFT